MYAILSELYEKEEKKTRYSVEDISIIPRSSASNNIFEQPDIRELRLQPRSGGYSALHPVLIYLSRLIHGAAR